MEDSVAAAPRAPAQRAGKLIGTGGRASETAATARLPPIAISYVSGPITAPRLRQAPLSAAMAAAKAAAGEVP